MTHLWNSCRWCCTTVFLGICPETSHSGCWRALKGCYFGVYTVALCRNDFSSLIFLVIAEATMISTFRGFCHCWPKRAYNRSGAWPYLRGALANKALSLVFTWNAYVSYHRQSEQSFRNCWFCALFRKRVSTTYRLIFESCHKSHCCLSWTFFYRTNYWGHFRRYIVGRIRVQQKVSYIHVRIDALMPLYSAVSTQIASEDFSWPHSNCK